MIAGLAQQSVRYGFVSDIGLSFVSTAGLAYAER